MSFSSSDMPFSDTEAGAPSHRPLSSGTAVGLSESQYSTKQRQLLDLMNKLHNTGLPYQGLQGRALAYGFIRTSCPTECRLSYSTKPWQCRIYLRFLKDSNGSDINPVRNVPFGPIMYSQSEIEDRIRRAQLAILAPNEDPTSFLSRDLKGDPVQSGGVAFSENYISVEISGPGVTNLSFCDLPGMIANVREGHDESDIELVKQMIESYIKKPSCIILLTVTCETDFENQGARKLAKEHDPMASERLVNFPRVLTKPDRIEPGEEDKWLSFIRGETEALRQGWFCVKQPSPAELAESLAWKETRKREDTFFNTREPWKSQSISVKQKFGTARLTSHLSDILSDLILKRLPSIQSEIHTRLHRTMDELEQLPKEVSEDPIGSLVGILVASKESQELEALCINSEAITRELPRNVPFIVKRQLIGEVIELWRGPIEDLLEGAKRLLTEHMRSLIGARFSQYEHGGLHSTLCDRYLADYKEKFKAYYSAARRQHHSVKESNFLSGLAKGVNDTYFSGSKNAGSRVPTTFSQNLTLVISKLSEMGVSVSPLDLSKLIETDTAIESLDVISEVQAYYQISYKRFVDTICMTADQALVRAFAKDLDMYLCKALGTSADNAKEKCAAFLANSNEVRLTREALSTRRDRLVAAKNEVLSLWSV
ncbi:P-loop containing nucleoside triphosphate hydrolase protein [Rhizoctonia solani]|nr:P-loop containing nucleoside triphosphate hydrolase protein [Rhizoctonia solani]